MENTQPLPSEKILNESSSLLDLRILFVDDSEDNRFLFDLFLGECGANVLCAESGQQALSLAKESEFDVVLMDIEMPGLNGYESFTALRTQGLVAPIVAVTGHGQIEVKNQTREFGFAGHVTKPIDLPELVKTVRRVTSISA